MVDCDVLTTAQRTPHQQQQQQQQQHAAASVLTEYSGVTKGIRRFGKPQSPISKEPQCSGESRGCPGCPDTRRFD